MHAEEAEPADFVRELARQDPLLEPLADLRQDPLAHPRAHGVPDRLLLVAQECVDRQEVERIGGRLGEPGVHGHSNRTCTTARGSGLTPRRVQGRLCETGSEGFAANSESSIREKGLTWSS